MDDRRITLERFKAVWNSRKRSRLDAGEQRKLFRLFLFGGPLIFAVLIGARAALDPWSLGWPGHPSLTGRWIGELTTPSGKHYGVMFRIEWAGGARCGQCSRIGGVAATCGEEGDTRTYRLYGDAETWVGDRFYIGATQDEDDRPGLRLAGMDGVWNGDGLEMEGMLASFDVQPNPALAPDIVYPTAWTMTRGARRDFKTVCAALTGLSEK